MSQKTILKGHTSAQTAFEVADYPYGFKLRTRLYTWIESKKEKGDRVVTYTINPKTGMPNKPKYTVYADFRYLYLDEAGHVHNEKVRVNSSGSFPELFARLIATIGLEGFNQLQQDNIRRCYRAHIAIEGAYVGQELPEPKREAYNVWVKEHVAYIKVCPFEALTGFDKPNPAGQV